MLEAMPAEGATKGLLETLRSLAATLVATAHTRLDLLSTDLEEDRDHLLSLIVTAVLAMFCLGVGVVLAALVIVVLFWDSHRLLVMSALAILFLGAGIAAGERVRRMARTKSRLFSSSLSELVKDRERLAGRP